MRVLSGRFVAITAGLTPEKIALIIAVGFVFGTFPVLGVAGVLCLAAAVAAPQRNPAGKVGIQAMVSSASLL